jgi:hypothetical protein
MRIDAAVIFIGGNCALLLSIQQRQSDIAGRNNAAN